MMGKIFRFSWLGRILLLLSLQSIILLAGGGLYGSGSALAAEISDAKQIQGIYVAHDENTMSFRKIDGVVRRYQISGTVRTIYIDGNEIDRRRLIFRTRCELKILNGVILEIIVLEEPS
jgi:hypothetical protein